MDYDLDYRERLERDRALDTETWLLGLAEPTDEELAWEETTFRRRILAICGYSPDDALTLALRPEIELQDAIALIRDGCAPTTAARILL